MAPDAAVPLARTTPPFSETARRIGAVTDAKHAAYGRALETVPEVMGILTASTPPERWRDVQFLSDVQVMTRVLEKFARLCGPDPEAYGENPWMDAAGYVLGRAHLLGLALDERDQGGDTPQDDREAAPQDDPDDVPDATERWLKTGAGHEALAMLSAHLPASFAGVLERTQGFRLEFEGDAVRCVTFAVSPEISGDLGITVELTPPEPEQAADPEVPAGEPENWTTQVGVSEAYVERVQGTDTPEPVADPLPAGTPVANGWAAAVSALLSDAGGCVMTLSDDGRVETVTFTPRPDLEGWVPATVGRGSRASHVVMPKSLAALADTAEEGTLFVINDGLLEVAHEPEPLPPVAPLKYLPADQRRNLGTLRSPPSKHALAFKPVEAREVEALAALLQVPSYGVGREMSLLAHDLFQHPLVNFWHSGSNGRQGASTTRAIQIELEAALHAGCDLAPSQDDPKVIDHRRLAHVLLASGLFTVSVPTEGL